MESSSPLGQLAAQRDEHAARVGSGPAANRAPGWVYFLQRDQAVKIGWSQDPITRVRGLGGGTLLATMPGYMADERALHRRFDLLRLDGEWFAYTPALARYVSEIAAEQAA